MAVKQSNDEQYSGLKKSIDILVLVELAKAGATYDQIRKVVGGVDNNTIAAVKAAVSEGKKSSRNQSVSKKE